MNTTGLSSTSLSQVIADRTTGAGGRSAVPPPGGEVGKQSGQQQGGEASGRAMDPDRMAEAQEAVNAVLEHLNVQLKLSVNRDLEQVVAKIVDRDTGEVVREIPPEEMLEMAKRLEEMSGLLLDERR